MVLASMISSCGGSDQAGDDAITGRLVSLSDSSATTAFTELEGSTVSGTIHVVAEVNGNTTEVHFHLNDGPSPAAVSQSTPFELLLDSTQLPDGVHSLSARVPSGRSGNTRELARASFTISNHDGTPVPVDPEDPIAPPVDPEDPPELEDPLTADFFVAPWGSDSAQGTFENPLLSLKRVAELAQPGDTIYLRGGIYDVLWEHAYLAIEMSGSPEAPITIKSYPSETAIFDGHLHQWHPRYENDGRDITNPHLLRITGNHLILEDITFRNGVGLGLQIRGNHNIIRHIASHHHHATGIHGIGSNNLFEHLLLHNNDSVANGGNSANGMILVNSRDLETRGNVIRHVLAYRNSDDGIDVWNSYDTLLEHNISFENGIGSTGNGRGFKLGTEIRLDSGTTARFNIAFGNFINYDTNGSTGVLLYNNTAWASRSANYVLTQHRTEACANTAYNNISYQPGSYNAILKSNCTTHENNTWNLDIDNPQFASLDPTSQSFLSLSTNSPAIDAGIDMGFKYSGNAPDLGALQAGSRLDMMLPLNLLY